MNKKQLIFFLATIIAAMAVFSADPFNYFVELKNFTAAINGEKASRYRVSSSDSEFTLIETSCQRVIGQRVINKKKIIDIEAGLITKTSTTIEEVSDYLKDTRFMNLNSPEITGTAAQLHDSKDPVRSAEDFVYHHISEKVMGIPLMPAAQVYRVKRGDCTEHSVLAVALLRKLRVPARAVVGMYLADEFMGRRNVFVYHMWAEAFWKGRWRLVDATRPGENRLNRYIAFTYHNLKAESPVPYLRAISSIQELGVTYLGK